MLNITIDDVRIECLHLRGDTVSAPIVILHEGLGSVAMWKDFPRQLANRTRRDIYLYSRQGYGSSDPIRGPRSVDYMHHEALSVLPQLLDQLHIQEPVLLGHSDGASIALIFAGAANRKIAGLVAMAPHVFVEDISLSQIEAARRAYESTDLRQRLSRYHDDVDGAFRGWNDIWLHPQFRAWNIEAYLPAIRCPVLAIQGIDDEYGTMEQIHRMRSALPHLEALSVPNCRHSPHRDQPAPVLDSLDNWLAGLENFK